MNKSKKNVKKDELNRVNFLKKELITKIFKIFLKSKNTNQLIKTYIKVKFIFKPKKSYINRQLNPCLVRGRFGGVYKNYLVCRHIMLKWGTLGTLHNTKVRSW